MRSHWADTTVARLMGNGWKSKSTENSNLGLNCRFNLAALGTEEQHGIHKESGCLQWKEQAPHSFRDVTFWGVPGSVSLILGGWGRRSKKF